MEQEAYGNTWFLVVRCVAAKLRRAFSCPAPGWRSKVTIAGFF